MTTPKRPAVFIEKIFPVKLLNEQVYYEHGGNPFKGLHRWYSRKPLSFSRASVLGSILPADVSIEEFEYLLGLYSEQEFEFWQKKGLSKEDLEKIRDSGKVRLYKTPPTEKQIKRVYDLCEQVWGKRTPAILDPFARGGSIPFEAARYGLEVFASDLNPVAVVTMKAAMEYPLKFGPSLQVDIDKWVKWVGDEAEKRLAEFFPCPPFPNAGGEVETIQNYLWAHTVVCPSCESVVPLSPNWWLYKRPEKQNLEKWCAVKPISNLAEKRVDFELIKGKKGKGTTIQTETGEYNPDNFTTISRGIGKCCNCGNLIEDNVIKFQAQNEGLGHQLYAVAFKKGKGSLEFRIPNQIDLDGIDKSYNFLQNNLETYNQKQLIPDIEVIDGEKTRELIRYGITQWSKLFNNRQLLTLVTYLEIINDAKSKLQAEYEPEKVEAIATYLALVMDRCADENCRLSHWNGARAGSEGASAQHSLNLMWNYTEISGISKLWNYQSKSTISDYLNLCEYFNNLVGQTSSLPISLNQNPNSSQQFSLDINIDCQTVNDNIGWQDASPTERNLIQTEIDSKDLKMRRRRLPHWELDGSVYFITFSTWEKLEIPSTGRQIALDCCLFFNDHRYKTYAVVIMPDHIHWLMQPLPKSEHEYWSLSSILQSIKSYSSKQIGKAINHIGTLWQDEYYDRIIRDDREFLETWKYIRDNPVKANLADYPENYSFFWQAKSLDLKDLNHTVGQTSSLPNISKKNDSSNSYLSCLTINDDIGCLTINDDIGCLTINDDIGCLTINDDISCLTINDDISCLTINDDIGWQDASPTKINDTNFRNIQSTIININLESADSLYHIPDNSIDSIITDPPYYGTIQYAELSDFFYVWQKRVLGDIFPDLFWQEVTDKDREAVANPSRFRNMGESPDELAKRDYEAKMALAWSEAYRVLRDEGVLTVQFNHKDSGAWDVLAKALIDAGFEITASWAVSTENPQNLHQANKNRVSSTVILVCRKRDRNAEQACWDDLRPEVANLVEQRAPEFEANVITGIDLYLSAFGPALNVFSRSYPILDSSGDEVRPDVAFAEARKAIANYRFRKLVQSDTVGFDPLTQWYLLAWDAFKAREFPFDEARQLALAIGGFNVNDLAKTYKLPDSTSGSCAILTPQQRLKKRAFTTNPQEFTATYLVDALHAAIAIYEEESSIQQVRQFMQKTGLMSNDLFMKTLEVAFRVIPDKAKEKDSLVNLWLGIDEIKAKVVYQQTKLF